MVRRLEIAWCDLGGLFAPIGLHMMDSGALWISKHGEDAVWRYLGGDGGYLGRDMRGRRLINTKR